ncbi:wiskott-Aldrich syndrome protein [Larimichthys crocea]|uniref:wiskott-Aldrich syndrome protein n=1 Tax=Larimichthys crocea TaxID=215358 RepID=UPI000F5FC470|nr:wiskott-Aldrich syndrome protein-like [Larimichthys crocea]
MASSLIPGCLVMSDLLTIREKGVLFTLLEPHCKLIKTTVAQLLVAKETHSGSPGWSCLGCGAICLIEDELIQSYFLQLYCVKRAKLLWKQELYIPFKYTATRPFFHTFPADDHQVGLNFADQTEAEEFHLSVMAVQRIQEKTIGKAEITNAEREDSSTSDPPDSGINPTDNPYEEQHLSMGAPSPTTSLFKDLDPTMRRLLMQAKITEEDLKNKDVSEAVDCIIDRLGLKTVQKELRSRGSVSQTLPRTTGASISLVLKKGPLPPVPSVKVHATTDTYTADKTPDVLCIPPPPTTPAPVVPDGIRRSASFNYVGSPKGDLTLTALEEVFRKKQLQMRANRDSDMQ